jgi:cytochrome oxidase assembly protein ShyY1
MRRGGECDVAAIMPGHQLTTEPAALHTDIHCRRRPRSEGAFYRPAAAAEHLGWISRRLGSFARMSDLRSAPTAAPEDSVAAPGEPHAKGPGSEA